MIKLLIKVFSKSITVLSIAFLFCFNQNIAISWSDWDAFDSPRWMKVQHDSETQKAIRKSSDYLQFVPLVIALGFVAYYQDTNLLQVRWREHFKEDFFNYNRYKDDGLSQLATTTIVSLASYYTISYLVQRPRPKHQMDPTSSHYNKWWSGSRSFYSGHSTMAYAPAFFIAWRYGWLNAIPALAIAGYTGWARIASDMHYITDVAVAAGMAALISWIFTNPYKVGKTQWQITPANGVGAGLSVQF